MILFNVFFFNLCQQTAGEKSVSAFPDGENLFYWVATIMGPVDTVSDGSPIETFQYFAIFNGFLSVRWCDYRFTKA